MMDRLVVVAAVAVAVLAAAAMTSEIAAAISAPRTLAIFAAALTLALLATAFWVWMLLDVALNEPSHDNTRMTWLLVVLIGQLLGALVYFFLRRAERMKAA